MLSGIDKRGFRELSDCNPEIERAVYRPFFNIMSQHPSLKGQGAIKAKRSVLKRFERVDLLRKRGQFKEGQRVIGLPKTKPEE